MAYQIIKVSKGERSKKYSSEEYIFLPGGSAHGCRGLTEATVGLQDDEDVQHTGAVEGKAPDQLLLFGDLHDFTVGRYSESGTENIQFSLFLSSVVVQSVNCCHGILPGHQ